MTTPQPSRSAAPRRRRTITEHGPDPVDVHVGRRMRQRRTLLGLSQEKMAAAFGVSFQQVQKYERGANRISAGRLYRLAKTLDVPVGWFFEGLPELAGEERAGVDVDTPDRMVSRETLGLVRAYVAIPDGSVRRRLADLVRAVAKTGDAALDTGDRHAAEEPALTMADGTRLH